MNLNSIQSGNGGHTNVGISAEIAMPFRITNDAPNQAALNRQPLTIGEEQLIQAIEKANKSLVGTYTAFEFSIHEKTKEIMVKVLDRDTGEIIREIPPEKVLDMVAKMWELAGILVDEKR